MPFRFSILRARVVEAGSAPRGVTCLHVELRRSSYERCFCLQVHFSETVSTIRCLLNRLLRVSRTLFLSWQFLPTSSYVPMTKNQRTTIVLQWRAFILNSVHTRLLICSWCTVFYWEINVALELNLTLYPLAINNLVWLNNCLADVTSWMAANFLETLQRDN